MQTGDCAGFGKQPNATARRLLSRALWVGGLAVAGSVFGAATANAADAEPREEQSGGLLGTLTSAVEPVTDVSGSLVAETDTLLTDELELTDDLLSDGSLVGEIEVTDLVEQPAKELTGAVGIGSKPQGDPGTRELAAERDAAVDGHTDRSKRREPIDEAIEGGDDSAESVAVAESDLVSLIGAVDRLLGTTVDAVPDVAEVADVGEMAGELASGGANGLLGEVVSAEEPRERPVFSTQAVAADPISAVTGLMTLLDLPLADGADVLQPLEPLLATLDPVVHASTSAVANTGPLAGEARQKNGFPAWPEPSTLDHTPNTSADTAPRHSHETGAARAAGQDGETAVIHSSLDAGTDGQDPSGGTRGGLRPSLLMTPVAGLSVLHVGAPGAATSADQAGPSSHALLPEEAVLRARLFSAAAYARNVEVKPLREANDPPVSPD